MKLEIQEISDVQMEGVRVALPGTEGVLRKNHFEWISFALETKETTDRIISGLLEGWHHEVKFTEVEYHINPENFYFYEGTCLMLFADKTEEDEIIEGSLKLVRIHPGTQVEVAAGKCHYVPIPETDTFKAFVFTPIHESLMIDLPEEVTG